MRVQDLVELVERAEAVGERVEMVRVRGKDADELRQKTDLRFEVDKSGYYVGILLPRNTPTPVMEAETEGRRIYWTKDGDVVVLCACERMRRLGECGAPECVVDHVLTS